MKKGKDIEEIVIEEKDPVLEESALQYHLFDTKIKDMRKTAEKLGDKVKERMRTFAGRKKKVRVVYPHGKVMPVFTRYVKGGGEELFLDISEYGKGQDIKNALHKLYSLGILQDPPLDKTKMDILGISSNDKVVRVEKKPEKTEERLIVVRKALSINDEFVAIRKEDYLRLINTLKAYKEIVDIIDTYLIDPDLEIKAY